MFVKIIGSEIVLRRIIIGVKINDVFVKMRIFKLISSSISKNKINLLFKKNCLNLLFYVCNIFIIVFLLYIV